MRYQIVDGAKISDGAVTVTGPAPLTFGTPEQVAFWLSCGAIAPVMVAEASEDHESHPRVQARRQVTRGRT